MNKTISSLDFNKIPDDKTIIAESLRTEGLVVLHACFGTKVNSTLSVILSSLLSGSLGYPVESRADAYRIVLSSNARLTAEHVRQELTSKFDIYNIMSASLKGTHNVNWKTWCVAKKFGVVKRGAVYNKKEARFFYERFSNTSLVKEALRELFHDKFDLSTTEQILEKIRNKEIEIDWIDVDKPSKLAEPILDHTTKYYSSPASIDKSLLDLVKKRLMKTKLRLICARCGICKCVVTPDQMPSPLRCKYCKGHQITATFYSDYELTKIIQKKHRGKKLTAEENKNFKRAWKVSSLLEGFDKTALIVLSGYGIGADTAARILRRYG